MMEPLAAVGAIGLGVGVLLGTLGGGGSILAVPLLVYAAGMPPQAAVTTSAAMVGVNSMLGAVFHRRRGALNGRVALLFGGAGVLVSYAAAGWSRTFDPNALMAAFALLMLAVGFFMLRVPPPAANDDRPVSLLKVLLSGALVGLVTGLLGVGGGFLIVPALIMLLGLPIREAIGTSLLIIAMNSAASFAGHYGGFSPDAGLIAVALATGLAGTALGSRLGERVPADLLRRAFAWFVIILAVLMLADQVAKLVG